MANESSPSGGATPPPLPAPPGERVQAASAELKGKLADASTPKGRGRPATPGSPHSQFKSPGVKLAPGEKPAAAGNGLPPFRPGVVERAVGSMLSVCDRTVKGKVRKTALYLTQNVQLADEFADEVAMTEEERRDIASLAELVCAQYALMGQHMPAALLVTHLAFYGGRVALTMHQLNQIAEFNRQHGKKAPPAQPEKMAA